LLNVVALSVPVSGWLTIGAVVFIIGGTLAQYFHGTLHCPDNPWIVYAMRRVGLLMTPQAHALHHATLRRDFATNTGWSNPLVNAIFRAAMRRGWLNESGLEPR
jgi:sterol desaturase/sphingolipid hydroxylase (fatty acid hydroxylase superfamily)